MAYYLRKENKKKGTYIKVLNDVVFDELKAIKASNSNLK